MKFKITLAGIFLAFSVVATAQRLIPDTAFNTGTGANGYVYVSQQLSGGKIFVGGQFTEFNGQPANMMVRLNADGSTDASFNAAMTPTNNVYNVWEEADGKLVVTGMDNMLKRLNTDGSLDASFNPPSLGYSMDGLFIAPQGDKYIISGIFYANRYMTPSYQNVARFNHDGSLDTSFNTTAFDNAVFARAYTLASGKIMVVGKFGGLNGLAAPNIIRLNADGTIDTTFITDATTIGGQINAIAEQTDGKYIVSGIFKSANGLEWVFSKRLNTDGSTDTSFTPATGDGVRVLNTILQPDGKIVNAGWFHDSYVDFDAPVDNSVIRYLERFNADGSPYEYTTGAGINGPVNCVSAQTDGKLLVGGWFDTIGTTPVGHIARLEEDMLSVNTSSISLVKIYPNPVKDVLKIQTDTPFGNNTQMRITDISGKTLYNKTGFQNEIDLASYTAGVYVLTITDGGATSVHKIIKK